MFILYVPYELYVVFAAPTLRLQDGDGAYFEVLPTHYLAPFESPQGHAGFSVIPRLLGQILCEKKCQLDCKSGQVL